VLYVSNLQRRGGAGKVQAKFAFQGHERKLMPPQQGVDRNWKGIHPANTANVLGGVIDGIVLPPNFAPN
jgi:hypothetical protein